MLRRVWHYRLAAVLALAIAVRLTIFVAFPSVFDFVKTGAIHGSEAYDSYAQNLLATGVYGRTPGVPDAFIPPLYSYTLAAVYGVFGRGALQVALFHITLDCLTITFLYAIGRRLMPRGEAVATLAGAMTALYPYLVFQNLTLIDTPFFMTLLYAFLALMVWLRERPRFDRMTGTLAIVGGVVLGMGALTRTNVVFLAPLIGLWFFFRLRLGQAIARLGLVALASILTIAPWTARNDSVYGVFVPISLNGGENFYQGNNDYTVPYFRAGYDVQWVPPPASLPQDEPLTPERSAALFAAGWRYLGEHPERIPELLWVKFLVHWSIDIAPRLNPAEGELPRVDYQGDVIAQSSGGDLTLGQLPPGDPVGAYSQPLFDQIGRAVHRFYWGGLFLLGVVGIVVTRRAWRSLSLLWFVQISMTLVYVVFHSSTRYRVPTDPLWFLFSASALLAAWAWLRTRRASAPAAVETAESLS